MGPRPAESSHGPVQHGCPAGRAAGGVVSVSGSEVGQCSPHLGATGEVSSKHGRVAAHPITVPFRGQLWPLGSPVLPQVRPALSWWAASDGRDPALRPGLFGAHTSGWVPALWVYSRRPGQLLGPRSALPEPEPSPPSAAGASADWPVSSCHHTLMDPDRPGPQEPTATFCPQAVGQHSQQQNLPWVAA